MPTYKPKPIDTSHVRLPSGVRRLIEKVAKHNHDIWAERRIKEGWTYGKQRDDKKKQHPDLVPYEKLSDGEKEYDRATAIGVVKAILAAGYKIEKG